MKKKIIYISGADVFDVSDVRAAFEEVRATLKLDQDVLLFGVPVDNFDAASDVDVAPMADSVADVIPQEAQDSEIQEIKETPKKQTKKPKKKAVQETPVVEEKPAEILEPSEEDTSILSVLATNQPTQEDEDIADIAIDEEEQEIIDDVDITEEATEEISDEVVEDVDDDTIDETSELGDMLSDDVPTDASEKTLEELLESMAPLREDVHGESQKADIKAQDDEIDATLENLASEFAETQDKVPTSKKSSERGKIGKLKNILPFKKLKRDDSGLMGDLFGWAGIAANDEDFTIPGFFTSAASKK